MPVVPSFPARVARAIAVGLPGVLVLPFAIDLPDGVPPAAAVLNPSILLILAAFAGAWAARKGGFMSTLILGTPMRPRALAAWALAGIAVGVAVALADHAAAPLWRGGDLPTLRLRDMTDLGLGLLYGGLTEEVLLRWGLLSILAVGMARLLANAHARYAAVALAAVAFAVLHLPAVQMETGSLAAGLVARTLVWNGLLGVLYGAAFVRSGLEAAILAHMGTHVGFAVTAI